MTNDNDELFVITEVGTFGNLNIVDPSKKKLERQNEDIMTVIKEVTRTNLDNLTKC